MRVVKTDNTTIESFRIEYFNSLPKFQDLFLELIVLESTHYLLEIDSSPIGYSIISIDNTMVELFIKDQYLPKYQEYFHKIIEELKVKRIYCKSFDDLLLSLCLKNSFPYKLNGYLFRDLIDNKIEKKTDLTYRFAKNSDLLFLLQQDDEVFEPKNQLNRFIANKEILLVQEETGSIIGCGFLTRIHPKYDYYDVGAWVNSNNRMRGYGTQIITYMLGICLENNWIPICGCDAQNRASQRMLNKVGFISKHTLIEFEINKLLR